MIECLLAIVQRSRLVLGYMVACMSISASNVTIRVINPLRLIVGDVRYRGWMLANDKTVRTSLTVFDTISSISVCQTFEAALYSSVTDPSSPYFGFQNAFVWEGRELRAWKMLALPPFMVTSQQKASWMMKIR